MTIAQAERFYEQDTKDYEIEKNNTIDPFAEATRDLTKTYISPIDTSIINIANYSPCIAYSGNYVVKLCNMVSALKIKDFQIETRNFYVNAIRNKGDLKEKVKCLQELIEFDRCEHESFLRTNIRSLVNTLIPSGAK